VASSGGTTFVVVVATEEVPDVGTEEVVYVETKGVVVGTEEVEVGVVVRSEETGVVVGRKGEV